VANKTFNLNIFMKSGNVIKLDSILSYKIEWGFEGLCTHFELSWHKPKTRLLVKSIDLKQIEGITCEGR
jgi:hypothetical protein